MQNFEHVQKCYQALLGTLLNEVKPQIGIILGTGLGGLAAACKNPIRIDYTDLPNFPQSMVSSHAGCFVFGTINGISVVLQQGRCHLYEGYSPAEVVMGVRLMATLGITGLVVTNAAGALNPKYSVGGVMLIDDHINMTGKSPLTGINEERWGVRFPDMTTPYDQRYMDIFEKQARQQDIFLEKGVYAGVHGPQMETRAETRMLRQMGADAVGMSTVQEVIAARHVGLRVVGVSVLSNKNLPECMEEASLEEIIAVCEKTGTRLGALIESCLPELVIA